MELLTYIFMAVGAYFAFITRRRGIIVAWCVSFAVYALFVRLQPPTYDMIAYTAAIETWPPPLIPYTLREPLIWIGAPFLHTIVGNRLVTFLIIDMLGAAIVFRTMKKLDAGDGQILALAPVILASYVSLLGMQNAWRQYIAFIILLSAVAARARNQRRFYLLFGLSILTHNSVVLLSGYCFDLNRKKGRRYGPLITALGVCLTALLQPQLGKSFSAHGLNTEFLYVAVAITIGTLLMYSNLGRLPGAGTSALFNFYSFIPAIAFLGSAQFERVAMMFLVLILLDIYRYHRLARITRFTVSQLTYAILVVPVILFPNALQMLLV